jgi:Leucine-rich repeat (LRR) protein
MENEFIKTNNGITYLDLTKNVNWKGILKSVDANTVIHQIYLDGNQIDSLEEVMSDLLKFKQTLWFLELSGNNIHTLPMDFYKLENLKSLEYRKNKLPTIPEQIFQLKKLEYLNISFNYLTSIPNSISNLTNLQVLIAQNKTEIEDLGNGIGELVNLKQLFIKTNLRIISKHLLKLQKLETIEGIRITDNDYQFLDVFKKINLISKLKLDYVSDNYSSLKGVDFKNIEVEVKSKINTASNKSIEILVNVVDINISPRY